MAHPPDQKLEFVGLARIANAIIVGAIIACAIVVPICVYSYGWRPERYLISPLSTWMYYGIAALTVLLLASLRLAAVYRISLSILLVSVACAIYAAELFLTWSPVDFEQVKHEAATGVRFDTRDRLEVIRDLAKDGLSAVPNVNSANLVIAAADGMLKSAISVNGIETLPLAGVSNTLTVYCNENGPYVTYESDEYGFHNPKGIWNASHVEVAAIGDSFTQGSCVPSDRNIVSLIRKRYPATLNAGIVNNGPLTELATLKEYLPAARPRVVLWLYCESNDFEDLMREKRTHLLTSYLQDDFTQGLPTHQAEIDKALEAFLGISAPQQSARRGATLLDSLRPTVKLERVRQRMGLASTGHREDPERAANLALFRQIMMKAKDAVDTWGGRFYFIYLPEWLRYAHPRTASHERDDVLAIVKSLGIPVIDIHAAFRAHGDPLALFPFRDMNAHYNEDGYRLVSDEVLRAIATNGN